MRSRTGLWAALGYLLLYAGAFALCWQRGAVGEEDLLGLVVVIGIGFSGLCWLATRACRPLQLPAPANPRRELWAALALTALIALLLVIGGHAFDWLSVTSPRGKFFFTLARKLALFVALPYWVFRIGFGYRFKDFGLSLEALRALWGRQGLATLAVSLAICAFQFFAGQAAQPLRRGEISGAALWVGLPLCFLWLVFEAGLVEEFFFRAILQNRLAASLRSETAGVLAMSILFGLAHAPGYFLRGSAGVEGLGANPTLFAALAYAIAVVSIAGLYLGIFYARTKNLGAVILIHAATDLFPNLSEFASIWRWP